MMLLLLLAPTTVLAQGFLQKTSKAVFTITTFKADGTLLQSAHGVFVGSDGEAVAPFSPFSGASRATVIDAQGKSYEVDCLLGASELYDVARFRVIGAATPAAPLAKKASAAGQKTWLVNYAKGKSSANPSKLSRVEQFNGSYSYYVFEVDAPDNLIGCPFVNDKGEVLGLLRHLSGSSDVSAADIHFATSLSVDAMSTMDRSLQQTFIRTALPNKLEDAQMTMMLARSRYADDVMARYAEEFVGKFPAEVDGYRDRADIYARAGNYVEADNLLNQCVAKAKSKGDAHFNYADIIYRHIATIDSASRYNAWSHAKAMSEINAALAIEKVPAYQHLKAQLLYVDGNYQGAYDAFMELTKSNLPGGEVYYEAAQSKAMLQAPASEIIVLLDSAVARAGKTQIGAPYILARGRMLHDEGRYRDALKDYNLYDTIQTVFNGSATADFYYIRYQCETSLRMYQQALNDIAHACVLQSSEPLYWAELASINLRVKKNDEAEFAAKRCIEVAPELADGYIFLGLAQIQKGQKAEGRANLEKAKTLGDERADELLKKYK